MLKEILGPGIVVYNLSSLLGLDFTDKIENSIGDLLYQSQVVDINNNDAHFIDKSRSCSEYMLNNFILEENDSPQKELLQSIKNITDPCLQDFKNMFSIEPIIDEGWIVLKYGLQDKFDWHIDSGRRYPRNVSATLYFNDNYDGGLIEYKHFGISYKPKRGDLVLFGSDFTYMHRVTPVTNGIRYAAVNWYRYSTRPVEYV
jgi:hypothetical protein